MIPFSSWSWQTFEYSKGDIPKIKEDSKKTDWGWLKWDVKCQSDKRCTCGQPTVTIGNRWVSRSQHRLPEGGKFVERKVVDTSTPQSVILSCCDWLSLIHWTQKTKRSEYYILKPQELHREIQILFQLQRMVVILCENYWHRTRRFTTKISSWGRRWKT